MPALIARQRTVGYANRDFRMVIRTEDGSLEFGVPWAPLGVEMTGLTTIWTEVARPADEAILAEAGDSLAQMKFEILLAHLDASSVEGQLNRLRNLAKSDERMIVSYGPSEAGLWRFTELTHSSILRDPDDNISQATASLTFTEVSDYEVALSPLSGGHVGGGKRKVPDTYKVQKGDTLVKIATKFYGDASWWRKIADYQKPPIKRPRRSAKLKEGRVLRLPDPNPKKKDKKGKPKAKPKKDDD